ncbi:hypothetical protein OPQ81_003029 [Rhizoctonia solani]|nr:hypothetical protein OPQ81_003029 [Rhizoctonia solani]
MDTCKVESAGVATAVQRWRAARTQLASAIQAFSEASASLDYSDFATLYPISGPVDQSLTKLDIAKELRTLATETKRLSDAYFLKIF